MNEQLFTELFWNHFPPEVRALRPLIADVGHEVRPLEDLKAAAWELALKGFTIDPLIMQMGIDPYPVIATRASLGYTWFPALGEERNYDLAPGTPGGLGANGVSARPYDPKNPTRRHIPCSLEASAWPPFDPPAEVQSIPTVAAAPDFTAVWCDGIRGLRPGDRSPIGTEYNGLEGRWRKESVPYGAFVSVFWKAVRP